MRFGYVLLGLVTLTFIHTSHGRCSNGLAAVQTDDICCDDSCGRCGGSGCGRLPGGSNSCCTSKIRDRGVYCSNTQDAPCIVRTVCDKGYPGVQKDDICCDSTCGTCGGAGCSSRPGGSDGCCSSRIRANDISCDHTGEGPCIVNVPTASPTFPGSTLAPTIAPTLAPTSSGSSLEPTGAPTAAGPTIAPTDAPTGTSTPTPTPTTMQVATCSNGLPGIGNGSICCELQCETCGGPGCSGRPGGEDGCCSGVINTSEVMCSEAMAAPCIIDN